MSGSTSSKVVLITGGSEGIGAACVHRFAGLGWSVAVLALPSDGLDGLAGPSVLPIPGDICDDCARREAVKKTIARFGAIDILVNNAGVGLYAPPSTVSIPLSKRVFDVNVFAPLALAQLVIPIMRRQGHGTIVNLGSVGGRASLPWAVSYCASKFALHAIDDSLRRELRRDGIHVMKVCPGIVATKFRDNVLGGVAPAGVSAIQRVVTPQEVAAAIVRGIQRKDRTVYVPWIARLFTALEIFAPRVMDWYVSKKWQ
jgi:NAD(P)-dependent dehydrogenase (short-subunit alcohol dehydrogenase family)